jgi:hypothetical protein
MQPFLEMFETYIGDPQQTKRKKKRTQIYYCAHMFTTKRGKPRGRSPSAAGGKKGKHWSESVEHATVHFSQGLLFEIVVSTLNWVARWNRSCFISENR